MKIFLFARQAKKDYIPTVRAVLDSISAFGWQVCASLNVHEFINKNSLSSEVLPIKDYLSLRQAAPDLAITLGGDGTILGVTTIIKDLSLIHI